MVLTWLWGDKYGRDDVAKLSAGFDRHLRRVHRFVCVTDSLDVVPKSIEACPIMDIEMTRVKGCFARLRMFDPAWQEALGANDQIVCADLDMVITGPLDPLFDRPEPFVILQGANSENPCPFNGSLMMLRAGAHSEVWSEFSLEKAKRIKFHEFPDDQGWIWHKIPKAAGWKAGPESGVYSFHKPGWPSRLPNASNALPKDARMVVFPGYRSPKQFKDLGWVKEHWVA